MPQRNTRDGSGKTRGASRGRRGGRGGLAFLLGMLAGAALVVGFIGGSHFRPAARPAKSHASAVSRPSHPAPPAVQPRRVPPAQTATPHLPRENPEGSRTPAIVPSPATPRAASDHPRVAIIFDDAGYSLRAAREVIALPRPVTISVLPDLPFSTPIAEEAAAHRVQILLHLPVQPDDAALDLGPGGVTVDMSNGAIARTVASDFATVPGAAGTNNHMGSRGTADPRVMRAILGVVKARRLFFVDSLTSPRSVGAETARAMGVRTAVRAVFLDSQDDDTYVRAQFHALIRVAQTRGEAIAIGHVGKVTARVLREMLPEFDEAGIQFVPVSLLVR
ncbi:MAG TPA: divergent polysaccharide deacetylase family protein [bacterium]|nr:divergent polysaccharide deacetylase family protein [bacterium]